MEKREREREKKRKSSSLHKDPIACISSPLSPPSESDFWPTMLNREQRGYQKSHPGEDHSYVGCLGQTCVLLPSSSSVTSNI